MVPAQLLAVITVAVAVGENGFRIRTILWLCSAGAVALLWATLYLAPLVLAYELRVANFESAAWVSGLLDLTPARIGEVLALNAPGMAAVVAALLLSKRAPLERRAVLVLGAWIATCLAFLGRYYGCSAIGSTAALCHLGTLPPHHYHFYLQAAWACVIGHTLYQAVRLWHLRAARIAAHRFVPMLFAGAILLSGAGWLLFRPYDQRERTAALTKDSDFDLEAYSWLIKNVPAADLFVTDSAAEYGIADFTVMASAHRLVAVSAVHSNPFVDWTAREARRQAYLSALKAPANEILCALNVEAGPNGHAWFLLPAAETPPDTNLVEAKYRDAVLIAYEAKPAACRHAGAAAP